MAAFANPESYELWMGRWSRRLAPRFVTFADVPAGSRLLDVGSGAGALSLALLEAVPTCKVVGLEPAESYVSYCRETLAGARLSFEAGDAQAIPFGDDSFDAALSLLILQEVPDPPLALREMRRVTRTGGVVAASQWDFARGMPMLALFWDTVLEVAADAGARKAAADCMEVAYPDEAALRGLWRDTGLVAVETERHEVAMDFASFADYWAPFLSNVTPTSSYVGTLPPEQAAEIERRLREKIFGDSAKRVFSLPAHAWAIRGRVP